MARQWTIGDILAFSNSHWGPLALQAGVQLDIFTALDGMAATKPEITTQELASYLNCNERALGMLCNALVSLGFLESSRHGLHVPDHSREYLSRHSPHYAGFIITHHAHLMAAWSNLAESVSSGLPHPARAKDFSGEEREAFLMGMFNIGIHQADLIASRLDFSGHRRLLDVGGGPGTYAVVFCRANPHLQATIFDKPTTKPFATDIIARYGLTDRVDFCGGDFLKDPLPKGYDVAWLSQVLHGESPQNAEKLIHNAARSLTRNGLLIVQEFVLDDDRTGPPHSALFGLNMLVGTHGGQTYTWSEISDMMKRAGAKEVKRLDVALPQGCGILVGTMP